MPFTTHFAEARVKSTGPKETFGVVFAYDSIKPETLIEHLRTIDADRMPYLPNMFVLYTIKSPQMLFLVNFHKKQINNFDYMYIFNIVRYFFYLYRAKNMVI